MCMYGYYSEEPHVLVPATCARRLDDSTIRWLAANLDFMVVYMACLLQFFFASWDGLGRHFGGLLDILGMAWLLSFRFLLPWLFLLPLQWPVFSLTTCSTIFR